MLSIVSFVLSFSTFRTQNYRFNLGWVSFKFSEKKKNVYYKFKHISVTLGHFSGISSKKKKKI